jgi:hypothetical protein
MRSIAMPRLSHQTESLAACGEDGIADFGQLHSREHDTGVFLYGFDLLSVDGADPSISIATTR